MITRRSPLAAIAVGLLSTGVSLSLNVALLAALADPDSRVQVADQPGAAATEPHRRF